MSEQDYLDLLTFLPGCVSSRPLVMGSYSLATSYLGAALVSGFNWINTTDLTGGFVAYV